MFDYSRVDEKLPKAHLKFSFKVYDNLFDFRY